MNKFDNFIVQQSPPNLDYGQLSISAESRYSSLMPWHIDQVRQCILTETKDLLINNIIDATAHIGIDTILLRLLYPEATIVAIEISPQIHKLLQQNVDNLPLITNDPHVKTILTRNVDSIDYIFNKYFDLNNVDLLYFDPPWGEDYQKKVMNVTLSNYHIGDIVNDIIATYRTLVVVKLPYNVDLEDFERRAFKDIEGYYNIYSIYTPSLKNPKISYMLAFCSS
jgi:predicted RNA methylase